ncbi:hypothetical protein BU15DRAFT_73593 [Melanogaster broomeanus]|nr:hypothetical protein BU15DRAFT_73593 [Melanogaster broomeanus]
MQALRKRNTFTFQSDDGGDDRVVLDEQEQAEVVERLKEQNATSDKQNRVALQVMLGLSCILHVMYWFSDRRSPLFAIFPPSPTAGEEANAPLDISGVLSYVTILVHVNLSLIIYPRSIIIAGRAIRAIGFLESLVWSAIPPLISIYAGKAWQTTVWWCTAGVLTSIVYVGHGWLRKADEEVLKLEKLTYRAAGA